MEFIGLEKNKEQIDKNKIFDSLDDIESINIAKKYRFI